MTSYEPFVQFVVFIFVEYEYQTNICSVFYIIITLNIKLLEYIYLLIFKLTYPNEFCDL